MPTARQQFISPEEDSSSKTWLDRSLLKTSLLQTHPRALRSATPTFACHAEFHTEFPCGNRMYFLFTISMNSPASCGRNLCKSGRMSLRASTHDPRVWWSQTGSNRRPPACKAGALPAELWPRSHARTEDARQNLSVFCRLPSELVGLGRLELPTSRLSSARSNQLSYKPRLGGRKPDEPRTRRSSFACRPGRKRNEGGEVPQG